MTRTLRERDDVGAVAVIVALVVTLVLIPVGALAIDLGNVYTRESALQSIADDAAAAGAAELAQLQQDGVSTPTTRQQVVEDVIATICAARAPVDQWDDLCTGTSHSWATDVTLTNGQVILYSGKPDPGPAYGRDQAITQDAGNVLATGIRVLTPPSRVEYGLARAFSSRSHADLQRAATARLFTALPRGGVLPIFAMPGETGTFCALDSPATTRPGGAACAATNPKASRGYLAVSRNDGKAAPTWNTARGIQLPVGTAWNLQGSPDLNDLAAGFLGGSGDDTRLQPRLTSRSCIPPGRTSAPTVKIGSATVEGAYLDDFRARPTTRTYRRTLTPLDPSILRCGRLAVVPELQTTPPVPSGGLPTAVYQVTGFRLVWLDDRLWSWDYSRVATGTCLQRGFNGPRCRQPLTAITGYFIDRGLLPATVTEAAGGQVIQEYLGSGLPAVVHLIRDVDDPPPG